MFQGQFGGVTLLQGLLGDCRAGYRTREGRGTDGHVKVSQFVGKSERCSYEKPLNDLPVPFFNPRVNLSDFEGSVQFVRCARSFRINWQNEFFDLKEDKFKLLKCLPRLFKNPDDLGEQKMIEIIAKALSDPPTQTFGGVSISARF